VSHAALEHLEEAEAALMSFISQSSAALDDGSEGPDVLPVLLAVMRQVSRAAGLLQAEQLVDLFPMPPDPNWRCWRGYPPFCNSLDPHAHESGYGCGVGRRPEP
jgi:hypothetical protein